MAISYIVSNRKKHLGVFSIGFMSRAPFVCSQDLSVSAQVSALLISRKIGLSGRNSPFALAMKTLIPRENCICIRRFEVFVEPKMGVATILHGCTQQFTFGRDPSTKTIWLGTLPHFFVECIQNGSSREVFRWYLWRFSDRVLEMTSIGIWGWVFGLWTPGEVTHDPLFFVSITGNPEIPMIFAYYLGSYVPTIYNQQNPKIDIVVSWVIGLPRVIIHF